ncbi:MAG TPA: TonB-dependent receptor [Chitinophagaceae bacterium]
MKKFLFFLLLFSASVSGLFAQGRRITGKVASSDGHPISGVNVVEKGTANGVVTDDKGNFNIVLSGKSNVLEVSYVGYETEQVTINNLSTIGVVLKTTVGKLEDVVVVGYGTQKKVSVVGAISQVTPTELQQSSTPNLSNSLAGRVSGVITIMGSGKPGSDNAQIFIRGMATTNNTSPLVLVDGIERNWQQIDPVDIESFSVLKDASATAVYGVRGANGVILITTKRGIKGRPVLSMSTQTAIQQPIRKPKYLRSYDFAVLTNEALRNDGKPEEYSSADLEHYRTHDSPYTHPDNDYYNDFLKKASLQQLSNISVRGGGDVMGYFVSANYMHQEGLYKDFPNSRYTTNTNYNRVNFRSNLDFYVSKTLQLSVDLNGRLEVRKQPNFDLDLFDKIRRLPPNFQSYINPNGTMGGRSDESRLAPYALISSFGNRERNTNVLEGAFKANKNLGLIVKGLSFRTLIGFNSSYESRRDIVEKPELWEYDRFGNYLLNKTATETSISTGKGPAARRISFEGALNYTRTFGDHAITGMALYQQNQYWYEGNVPTGYLGWVGRGTYAYKTRYLFEVNAGYNGSMQFAKGHRYGFFPAVSAGWIASEEGFWKKSVSFIDFFKLRGSYGEIGNDKIGNFSYLYQQRYYYAPDEDGWKYYWGETPSGAERGIMEGQPGNPNVSWERAKKANIGFDAKMFDRKLSATVDFFYERRIDILAIPYSVPLVLGMNNPQGSERKDHQGLPPENIGRVTNRGIDMELGYTDNVGKVNYFIKGNFTYAHNVINRIDEEGKKYEWQKIEGKSIGQHFGLTDIGLYSFNDFEHDANGNLKLDAGFPILAKGLPVPTFGVVFPGDAKYKDLNGDGFIDSYDVGAIGKGSVPQYSYGIYLGASYKNLELTALVQGAGGADIYFKEDAAWEFFALGKVMQQHLGRYNPNDPSSWDHATYPRLHPGENTNNHQKTTRWLFSRNYTRLKNVELGYRLPKSLLSRINMSGTRIFINGTNLLTSDKMNNWDPESGSEVGNDYPQLRTWNIGINVTF